MFNTRNTMCSICTKYDEIRRYYVIFLLRTFACVKNDEKKECKIKGTTASIKVYTKDQNIRVPCQNESQIVVIRT